MKQKISLPENPFGYTPKGFVFEYMKNSSKQNSSLNVLDFGCRNGDLLYEMYKKSFFNSAVGSDLDGTAIDIAKKLGINIDFRLIEKNHRFKEEDNAFDIVSIVGVVEHVYDQVSLLTELRRVVKNEGAIIIAVPGQHFFSFLDMGNFKFRFPKVHKIFYRLTHSETEYISKYVSNEFGCIGDIEAEKSWHEHFSKKSMQSLIDKVGGLEIIEIDGFGFFYRILINFNYFLPSFLKKIMNRLVTFDMKNFNKAELIFILKKVRYL